MLVPFAAAPLAQRSTICGIDVEHRRKFTSRGKVTSIALSLRFEYLQCLMSPGGLMEIIAALKQEEAKLQQRLTALQGAITALNGGLHTTGLGLSSSNGSTGRRTMSA